MDRLKELNKDIDLEMAEKGMEIEHEYMSAFLKDVDQIKTWLTKIRWNIETIEELYGTTITTVTNSQSEKSDRVSIKLETFLDETNGLTYKVRDILRKMRSAAVTDTTKSETRMRNNIQNMLTMKFLGLITDYQEVQQKYKNKQIEKARRQIMIVYPDASQDQIDHLLESGIDDIFSSPLRLSGLK